MVEVLAETLLTLQEIELPVFIRFIMGRIFPDWSPKKIGIGPNLLFEGLAYVIGKQKETVIEALNSKGDIGTAVEELVSMKEQTSFFSEQLTLLEVYAAMEKIASIDGKGSQREKNLLIRRFFGASSPLEARYLARLLLEDLRIGVGEGTIRDAIAKVFDLPVSVLDHAIQVTNDIGEVAFLALKDPNSLNSVKITLFHPVRMMLAQAGDIATGIHDHGKISAEYKYDGSRFQFHRKGKSCRVYSRKLEDITSSVPDVTEMLMSVTSRDIILDGEVIAVKDGRPLPFQTVLRRVRRKNEVEAIKDSIELTPLVFDILYLEGNDLISLTYGERREILLKEVKKYVAPNIISDDPAEIERYYMNGLDQGHEGIMLKVLSSQYTPGVRGKSWLKIKPHVDTLDLVVTGADWGEGKRAHVFGSFHLACRDNDYLIPISKVATGFSDEELALLYDVLKDIVVSTKGKSVILEPNLVFEIGYSEIQKSPNYSGGYALRFPRFISVRPDKSIDDIDTIETILDRYDFQEQHRTGSNQ